MAKKTETYTDLLDKPADQFEAPKAFPPGTYLARIDSVKDGKWEAKDGRPETPYKRVMFAPLQPGEDLIDADMSAVQDKFGRGIWSHNFNLTEDGIYFFVKWCAETAGIPTEGKSPRQLFSEIVGCTVIVEVDSKQDQRNPELFRNNIVNMTKA